MGFNLRLPCFKISLISFKFAPEQNIPFDPLKEMPLILSLHSTWSRKLFNSFIIFSDNAFLEEGSSNSTFTQDSLKLKILILLNFLSTFILHSRNNKCIRL